MYLLIDSCSLFNLVYSRGYSQTLIALVNSVNDGHIHLMTHRSILVEWEKHKHEDKDRKLKKLLNPAKKKNDNELISLLPAPISISIEHIELQISQIDELLKKANVLPTPTAITNEFAERFREGKAPLHNKKDSLNDWEIIGSAGVFCENNNIHQLYFVSYNSTDFGSLDDPTGTIHPDLQERFKKVDIHYYKDVLNFITDISQPTLPRTLLTSSILKNEKYTYKASVKENDLDSLYYVLKDNYEEVIFIPHHILRKYHPFAKAGKSYVHYDLFTLSQVRDNLISLFENIEIADNKSFKVINEAAFSGIKDFKNKIEYVLNRLTNNLIFNLRGENNKSISVRYSPAESCDCFKCCFYKLDWIKSLAALENPESSLEDKLQRAYYYYKFGNYNAAAKLYQKLISEAYSANKYFFYYICQYNLRHLGRLLENPFVVSEFSEREIQQMKDIDPIEECIKLKSVGDYDLLEYIADGAFFHESLDSIITTVNNIEEHYFSYLNGGWSSNNYPWQLIEEFAVLDSFINGNTIIYDAYSNFDRLFEQVVKGLFASHAMKGTDNSALESFDDYLVGRMILYGNKKILFKYFNRYKLKELVYQTDATQKEGFINLVVNFFNTLKLTPRYGQLTEDRHNLTDKYSDVLDTLLTLAIMLNLKKQDIKRIATLVYKFISSERTINRSNRQSIAVFITQKAKYFNSILRNQYTMFAINDFVQYEPDLLIASIKLYPTLGLPKLICESLIKKVTNSEGGFNNIYPINLLRILFDKVKFEYRKVLSMLINKTLNTSFNYELYYQAVMYDLINFDEYSFFKLLKNINLSKKRYNYRSIYTNEEVEYIHQLDELLNVAFKFNVNTQTMRFAKFGKLSPYYKWILDVESFNYKNFKTEWVAHYPTKYYLKIMAGSVTLKNIIQKYLKNKPDPSLERPFISVLCYQESEENTTTV